jgi:hypothetical protein
MSSNRKKKPRSISKYDERKRSNKQLLFQKNFKKKIPMWVVLRWQSAAAAS